MIDRSEKEPSQFAAAVEEYDGVNGLHTYGLHNIVTLELRMTKSCTTCAGTR